MSIYSAKIDLSRGSGTMRPQKKFEFSDPLKSSVIVFKINMYYLNYIMLYYTTNLAHYYEGSARTS